MPLAHTVLAPASGEPEGHLYFLHGILGNRANLRGIAKRVIERRPGMAAVLVDLREHGDSLGLPGPDTVEQAAEDVAALAARIGRPVDGIVGHSFGGKVAMAFADRAPSLDELWVIDSAPGARPSLEGSDETLEVIEMLERAPARFEDREAFVAFVQASGFSVGIAQWLAMSLRRTEDGARAFGPDLRRIRALLASYAALDLWRVVDPPKVRTGFVVGERSAVVSAADRRRLSDIEAHTERLRVHMVADAGHWVHVDAPDSVIAALGDAP